MIVPPGRSSPLASAASIILSAMRSFTEPPGFRYSTFARIVAARPSVTDESRTSGVPPTSSEMCCAYFTVDVLRCVRRRGQRWLSRRSRPGAIIAPGRGTAGTGGRSGVDELVASGDDREQPEQLEVQPDQRDDEAEGGRP